MTIIVGSAVLLKSDFANDICRLPVAGFALINLADVTGTVKIPFGVMRLTNGPLVASAVPEMLKPTLAKVAPVSPVISTPAEDAPPLDVVS